MTKTSKILSIHQENTCTSSLDLNLIILTEFHSIKVNENNLKFSQFAVLCKGPACFFGENLKMTKTSLFCSIHQQSTCKSCLHLNLIILTEFHSIKKWMTTNLKFSQFFQFSAKVLVCFIGENLKMTKTS